MSNRDIAFYYPGHLWLSSERMKTALLFFDGLALLVPEYKKHEPEYIDPVLAEPLRDAGLLHYLVADEVISSDRTRQLAAAVERVIEGGHLDTLMSQDTAFHELSMSRLGYAGDNEIAQRIFEALANRGLARETEDGVSIPMHPYVRYLILILWSQLLRPSGAELGLDLAPTTDRPRLVSALAEVMNLSSTPSAATAVEFDLNTVGVDLSAVPIDEILDFKQQHREKHQRYVRNLRKFAREVSLLPPGERQTAFDDRQAALDDYAADVRRVARTAWRKPARIALGLAGAAFTVAGNPIAGLFGACGAIIPDAEVPASEYGAFSYLISANERF